MQRKLHQDFARLASCSSLLFPALSGNQGFAGGHRGAEIPVPIPNTEVKGPIAEGSASLGRARVGRRRLFYFLFSSVCADRPTVFSTHPLRIRRRKSR